MPSENAYALIDSIYEAAVVPEKWQSVIENVALSTGAFGGSLFTVGANGTGIVASENCREHLNALLNDGWSDINIRAQRVVSRASIGFLTDHDFATEHEIANHPIYRDFLRPRGLGWSAGAHIVGAGDDIAVFSIDRLYTQGPFDRSGIDFLDELRPHISRSILLARKFQEQAILGNLQGLQAVGIPAAAISERGKIKLVNEAFEALTQQLSFTAHDRLSLADSTANALLKKSLEDLRAGYRSPMSIGVKGEADSSPFVLHLTPVRGVGRDVFGGIEVLLTVVPLAQPGLSFKALVQRLYDFTTAEARVAENMIAGRSTAEIAAKYNLGIETVRTQTKSVFAKTGISRQAELIARFASFNVR